YTPAIPVATFTHDQAAKFCASIGGALPNLSQITALGRANPRSQNWPTKFPYFVDTPGRVYDLEKNRSSETANPTAYVTCTTPISMTVTPTPPYTATDTTTIEAGDTETFTVQVTDAKGRPVEGATIRTSTSDSTTTDCNSCLTGADGKVLITQTAKTSTTDTVTTFTLVSTGEEKRLRTRRIPDADSAHLTLLDKTSSAFVSGHPLGSGRNRTKWKVTDRYGNPHNILPTSTQGSSVAWYDKDNGIVQTTLTPGPETDMEQLEVHTPGGSVSARESATVNGVRGWIYGSTSSEAARLPVAGQTLATYGYSHNVTDSECGRLFLKRYNSSTCSFDMRAALWRKNINTKRYFNVAATYDYNEGARYTPVYARKSSISTAKPGEYNYSVKINGKTWYVRFHDDVTNNNIHDNCGSDKAYGNNLFPMSSPVTTGSGAKSFYIQTMPILPPGLNVDIRMFNVGSDQWDSIMARRGDGYYGRDAPKHNGYTEDRDALKEYFVNVTKSNTWGNSYGVQFNVSNFNMTKDSSRAKKYWSKLLCTYR
ncbi:hypothetical protein CGI23_25510, partial [Vibrio parahaemolyticus]|uniref:hypothetical protein n=1 Tax=Vibrio parahaemolyticus TaxID=670 RepID=UPI001174A384